MPCRRYSVLKFNSGRDIPDGKGLQVDEAEVRTVKMIFELAELGRGAAIVARTLNAQGSVRRNGQPWTRRRVAAVLARGDFYRDGAIRYGPVTAANESLVLLRSTIR